MGISLTELSRYTAQLLKVSAFNDYCPNGLQVEGRADIKRIVTGVTACEALIDQAIAQQADALIVHHGFFWKGEDPCLSGMKGRRIKKLMQADISLLAYHLPLDAHPTLGNNAQLAQRLGWKTTAGLDSSEYPVGLVGELEGPLSLEALSQQLHEALDREPLFIGDAGQIIERLAWCTGAAQSYIDKAVAAGVDCFISGEISEPTVHVAREMGVAYIAAGHHATERYGVKALGEHLAQQFAVDVSFVDIDNPV